MHERGVAHRDVKLENVLLKVWYPATQTMASLRDSWHTLTFPPPFLLLQCIQVFFLVRCSRGLIRAALGNSALFQKLNDIFVGYSDCVNVFCIIWINSVWGDQIDVSATASSSVCTPFLHEPAIESEASENVTFYCSAPLMHGVLCTLSAHSWSLQGTAHILYCCAHVTLVVSNSFCQSVFAPSCRPCQNRLESSSNHFFIVLLNCAKVSDELNKAELCRVTTPPSIWYQCEQLMFKPIIRCLIDVQCV